MQTIRGIHYKTGEPVIIVIDDGIIKNITPLDTRSNDLPFIAPGLIDLQVNGYNGIDFNSPHTDTADVLHLTTSLFAEGVTTFLPTIITNSDESIKASLRAIDRACAGSAVVASCVGGIHLEGPFISPLDGPVGAHNKQFVKAPDWKLFMEFYEASGRKIRIITLSPEWPEAAAFTRQCINEDVLVSIGHTAAGSLQISRVVEAGARLSTHLGNGTHQVLPRHPNYIWDQLADDRLAACFIGDGFHLPAAVIKVILKVKGRNAILVSDSVSVAGMPPGNYTTPVGGRVVLTADGRLHLAGDPGTLAGSAQTLIRGVANLCRQNICSMADAWDTASVNAARLLKLPQQQGIHEGAPADLVVFYHHNSAFEISTTYKNGISVYAL